jgi:preprotein translocase subunit SecY
MKKFLRVFQVKELREALLFILFVLTIFRVAAYITIPGIDTSSIAQLLNANQFLGLLNVFSGGTLESFSIVALGVAPYITASIIVQLLGMIFPSVEEMQKDEQGRQKLNRWTRVATVPLALIQGYGLLTLVGGQGSEIARFGLTGIDLVAALLAMTTGTIFLMWLGELISERNVGNGISILILAGIVAGFPRFVQQLVATYTPSDLVNIIIYIALTIVTVIAVVIINEGQRNIPVQYARGGGAIGRVQSHLPIRVNMGGMIPIIFAIAMLVFPPLVAQFFLNARTQLFRDAATTTLQLFGNSLFYGVIFFLLVFGFTFFYATVIFKPETVAENLQKQGGFVPGIRPGKETELYLTRVKNRVLLTGATFLGLIAVLPLIVQEVTRSQNLVVGGASILILVAVIIDILKQIDSQLSMREYNV